MEKENPTAAFKAYQLHACRQTLLKINNTLSKAETDFKSSNKLDRVCRTLKWPFSSDATRDLTEELGRHKANIELALAADSMEMLLEILSRQDALESGLEGIKATIMKKFEADTRVKLDAERKEAIKFFSKVNPTLNFRTSLQLRHPMTGLWLVDGERFLTWKSTPNSKLWLSGIPGAGKTVLCGAAVENVLQDSKETIAVAYFFCDYKNLESQDAKTTFGPSQRR